MAIHIGRREFIVTLAGAAAAGPLAARAQQPAIPVIGILHSGSPSPDFVAAVRKASRSPPLIVYRLSFCEPGSRTPSFHFA